jgi:hypothetical protein
VSDRSPPANWRESLEIAGIAGVECPYSSEILERWNRALDPLFAERTRENRSYVRADELLALGILEELFRFELRGLITAVMADAVLLHCHVYEIAPGRSRSHVRGLELRGWHRDLPARGPGRQVPDFASIFLYLSDVGPDAAPFEAVRGGYEGPPRNGQRCISITGPPGTFFIWNRALLHRAAPNRAVGRRRLLKLSIQHNRSPNPSVVSPAFRRLREHFVFDPFLFHLFGGNHGSQVGLPGSAELTAAELTALPLADNARIELGVVDVVIGTALTAARALLGGLRPPPAY